MPAPYTFSLYNAQEKLTSLKQSAEEARKNKDYFTAATLYDRMSWTARAHGLSDSESAWSEFNAMQMMEEYSMQAEQELMEFSQREQRQRNRFVTSINGRKHGSSADKRRVSGDLVERILPKREAQDKYGTQRRRERQLLKQTQHDYSAMLPPDLEDEDFDFEFRVESAVPAENVQYQSWYSQPNEVQGEAMTTKEGTLLVFSRQNWAHIAYVPSPEVQRREQEQRNKRAQLAAAAAVGQPGKRS